MRRSILICMAVILSMTWLTYADSSSRIFLKSGIINIENPNNRIPEEWRDESLGTGYYLVHFDGKIKAQWRRNLLQQVKIIDYIPDNTYLVYFNGESIDSLKTIDHVDWVGLYQPIMKVDPYVFEASPDGNGIIKIRINLFPGEPFEEAINVLTTLKYSNIHQINGKYRRKIVVSIKKESFADVLKSVAFVRSVEWIQVYPEYHLCNDYTQWVCQSGPYSGGATPLYDHGILGAGQIVGVMDTGADADMCYFYDSSQGLIVPGDPANYDQRKIVAYIGPDGYASSYDTHGHGTHTACTIAGDDFATIGHHDSGDGIALLAKLIIQDYGDSADVYPPDDEYGAHQAVFDLDGRVHSNSWGWPSNHGNYHDDCQEVDQFIWDHPRYTIVYAAGNEGPTTDTIRAPGTSKNVITVGATENGAANPENNESFSGHGPTDDGRLKPDITMPGGDINSAASDSSASTFNCSTTSMSGTSMATPGVAGAAALIRDYFMQGFYPSGMADSGASFDPTAALVKAIMINSGVNMTGNYTADSGNGHADIPSNGQGWGRVTLDTALYFWGDDRKLFLDDNTTGILDTKESIQYLVAVADSSEPLEVTLVWSDYPSNPSASVNLVNDLDLTVEHNSDVYYGNHYQNGESITGGTADHINNVECFQLNTPDVGVYTITVTGFNIPQGPQPYALVVTGALNFSDGAVSFDNIEYGCSATALITVSDADLEGNGFQNVLVESDSDPSGETITLTEQGSDSGVFQGTIQLTTDSPGSGEILIAHGDTLTVTYIDQDDGQGGTNIAKTDTASVDCVAPVISNVHLSYLSENEVTIEWNTDEPADSVVIYGTSAPPDNFETNSSLTSLHSISVTNLEMCTDYIFSVRSSDRSGNETTDDNGGSYYSFTTYQLLTLMSENMDSDPGWTYTGEWAWGTPAGIGGDPSSGYTGTNVIGYNLNGTYPDGMTVVYTTTNPINCSGASTDVKLSFWRWLGVENSSYDHADIEISTDGGSTWDTIWTHSGSSIQPNEWTYVEYDITGWAANQSDVRIRWGMGPSDGSINYCGWNIDDVTVTYTAPCSAPNLVFESFSIDDSSGGNSDGEINGGETIAMDIRLHNYGLDASDVSAELSTSNPHINLINNISSYPDIPQGGTETSLTSFVFEVSEDVTDGEMIPFSLSWTSQSGTGFTNFSAMIVAPILQFHNFQINDATSGDNDGVLDPGEIAQLIIDLTNIGHGTAHNVSATLTSNHPEYIVITDNNADFPDIPSDSTGSSLAPHYTVSADSSTPDHQEIEFYLDIVSENYTNTVSFVLEVTPSNFIRRYFWSMDTNPNWVCEGDWAWGIPQGSDGDPSSGYTGENVYGYNLNGDYTNNLPEQSLISEAIDCSSLTDIEVRFMRWLGVESSTWDYASFSVSNDGNTWTTIWENPDTTLNDNNWQAVTYDISDVADDESTVYLKWVMGPTDGSVTYCGWNLDDIEIWGNYISVTPSPTPTQSNDPTPTPSSTPTSTPTFAVTPTITPPPPSPTPTTAPPTFTPTAIPPTPTPTCPLTSITCNLNKQMFHPGDDFILSVTACNGNQDTLAADVYIVLDVYGMYFFWPSWSTELDYSPWSIPACSCIEEDILSFVWPDNTGSANDIIFYVAMFYPGTFDLIDGVGSCLFNYTDI